MARHAFALAMGGCARDDDSQVGSQGSMEAGRSMGMYGAQGEQWERRLRGHPALTRLCEWVRTNDPLHLTLSHAAALACVERQYLSAIFRRYAGVSFVEWRSSIRTSRAAHLMVQEGLTVEQVVQAVGYKDRRSLERAFKRFLGTTPKGLKEEWSRRRERQATETDEPGTPQQSPGSRAT